MQRFHLSELVYHSLHNPNSSATLTLPSITALRGIGGIAEVKIRTLTAEGTVFDLFAHLLNSSQPARNITIRLDKKRVSLSLYRAAGYCQCLLPRVCFSQGRFVP